MRNLLETIKFEIGYTWSSIRSTYRSIIYGIKNFIKYRNLIWNDRWYDYSFLHEILRFKLNDMKENWESAHYVGSEYELKLLEELVQILDTIESIENGTLVKGDFEIDNLYQDFGEKLFTINMMHKVDSEFDNGEHISSGSPIRRLWD